MASTPTYIGSAGDPDSIPFALPSSTAEFKQLAAVVRQKLHEEDYLLSGNRYAVHSAFGAWPVDGLGTAPRFINEGEIRWSLNPVVWGPATAVAGTGTPGLDSYAPTTPAIAADWTVRQQAMTPPPPEAFSIAYSPTMEPVASPSFIPVKTVKPEDSIVWGSYGGGGVTTDPARAAVLIQGTPATAWWKQPLVVIGAVIIVAVLLLSSGKAS